MAGPLLEAFSPHFFKQLQQLKIHTRRSFLGNRQGLHKSPRKGHGLEFADYRAYSPGDDFRHIDWGIYGKTDRLYVRQFTEEQDLNVMFLVDGSSSMAYPTENSKYHMACQLALSLGYVALTDGDSVTFSLLGQTNSPKYVGPRALHRVAKFLEEHGPSDQHNLANEARAAVARQRTPGRCFILSDFLFDNVITFEAIRYLSGRNFEVSLIHILSHEELSLNYETGGMTVNDSESGESLQLAIDGSTAKTYASILASHVEELEQFCASLGVAHILVSNEEQVDDIVLKRLPDLGLLR